MDQLIVLGTGNATVTKCYNTCFAIRGGAGTLLVDAGGGNGILVQLEKAGIGIGDIHDLIVTHKHSDHVVGVIWIVRLAATLMNKGKYEGDLRIYCHDGLIDPVVTLCQLTLDKKFLKHIGQHIHFIPVADGETREICGYETTFFDIHSTKEKQYGFSLLLSDGQKLCCLGDEPYNPACERYVLGADWLLCEAFCLYADRERFKPYEKHHSTVKEACELAGQMKIPNLVLWHTEDKNYDRRKELYTTEGQNYYQGNLFVPYDLETITLR
ncbi:MBL fold metallo-hydrolase [Anaerotruncus sp. AF02-27]|uniref:MBL fold metallo-hydrolase n=1 Tax=Anaerotruncus TaxID=244127 RepID=UPI000E54EE77|nr:MULTISPECIES: MBL fold metallo-hydrolase [Anaerotruncus]RGX55386.1 MBL fold metallo-hydrolase [Anaerotruncus sp. AF02-27]